MDDANAFLTFYDPVLYDREIGPGSRVPELYHALAVAEGGPILELGCGTGNILLPIARSGIEVWGLDASDAMLACAKDKVAHENLQARVNLVQGYMQAFALDRCFRQIYLANEAIEHLLDAQTLLETLRRSREHLLSGGRLVLDTATFDVRYLARYSDPDASFFRHRGVFPWGETQSIQVWERTVYDTGTSTLTAHFRYETLSNGRLVETTDRTLVLRPRSVDEVRFALIAAGFETVKVDAVGPYNGAFFTAQ